MLCTQFQERVDEFLDGTLDFESRAPFERHVAECARCRGLVELLCDEIELAATEPPEDLTAAILERTTGSACDRAHDLLCDDADGALDGLDAELLRMHRSTCDPCDRLALTLRRLPSELSAMSSVVPDDAFADDVLRQTLPANDPSGVGAWLAEVWARLTRRPRFAFESAYVGAMILVLVFAVPGSPLSAAPAQALGLARANPVQELHEQVANLGREARWSVRTSVEQARLDVERRYPDLGLVTRSARQNATEVGQSAIRLDLNGTSRALQGLSGDLLSIWNQLTSNSASAEGPADETSDEQGR
ncbi:MAG: zf-HC2 domain-containing protein [bacterium]|nr:zf-HC2 domain-containing protein [bacterium]